MYRLVCISGQENGKTYTLKEGENSIGRLEGADIKVPSAAVSKKHAVIVIKGDSVTVVDLGSKNGTFVNGVMVKRKDIKLGDKIGVHDHVFQLVPGLAVKDAAVMQGIPGIDFKVEEQDFEYKSRPRQKPTGLIGGIDHFIETTFMPFFENVMKKYPVSVILTIVSVLVSMAITLIVTIPVVQFDQVILDREASQRGIYVAHILSESNKDLVSMDSTELPTIKAADGVPGVQAAIIVDVEGRILAPVEFADQYLTGPQLERIKVLKEDKTVREASADVYSPGIKGKYVITAPIKAYSQEQDSQVVMGFAQVIFSTTEIQHSLAAAWQRIMIGIVIASFLGLLLAIFFSKLFSLPFLRLYDELDLGMKGDAKKVNFSMGSKYGRDLVELINILLRKARRASAKVLAESEMQSLTSHITDDMVIIESVGKTLRTPFVVIDPANMVVFANRAFTEISTGKTTDWYGTPLVDAIQEQNILGVILSLVPRCASMGQDISEDAIVNDRPYRITVNGIRDDRGNYKYYCISVEII
ncbi:MAG: FHA domain-containing protein [Oligoflexia bacterium]|nr:FHA domain-containing protein [Oligoflexia bacterium]